MARGGSTLVNDYHFTHELVKARSVQLWIDRRDEFAVTLVKPNFDFVLSLLLKVVSLQVVDNGNVVDEAAVKRDVLMAVPKV